jgi:hypothetical protein
MMSGISIASCKRAFGKTTMGIQLVMGSTSLEPFWSEYRIQECSFVRDPIVPSSDWQLSQGVGENLPVSFPPHFRHKHIDPLMTALARQRTIVHRTSLAAGTHTSVSTSLV